MTVSIRTCVAGGAAALAVVAAAFGAVSANASTPAATASRATVAPGLHTTTSTHLTVDSAAKAAQAALDAAEKDGQRVTVAVVDRNGTTVVTLRGDGAGPQSYESAEKKAFTAVAWNAPTSALVERLAQAPTLKDIPGTLFLAGAVPVAVKGAPVAGIGVAGAPSGAMDEDYARAGLAALTR
ncbi:GlcG/HbpS family heme-binding protein [Mumia sp. DW29H23]|uniref:GlcG/HbpS family heme-binding protein n=1 Tax=Mumia sp. DW29H23 TaxID=3421241 RepID=UPI003D68D4D4